MIKRIGELKTSSGEILLQMWESHVDFFERPFIQHNHLQFEISMVMDGCGQYMIGQKQYPMENGDFFIFTSNESHYITMTGPKKLILLNLHFAPNYLFGDKKDSLSESHMNLCYFHSKDFDHRILARDAKPIASLLLEIKDELEHKKEEMALVVKSLLNLILVHLIRDYNFSGIDNYTNQAHVSAICHVMEYLEDHYASPLTLQELAKIAKMSPTYFSTIFRKLTGNSVWDCIRMKRIEKSISLLITNSENNSILEIALQSGFNNTANFNKAFRNYTGMTPSEYRRHCMPIPDSKEG